jgi:hypothetical protein
MSSGKGRFYDFVTENSTKEGKKKKYIYFLSFYLSGAGLNTRRINAMITRRVDQLIFHLTSLLPTPGANSGEVNLRNDKVCVK